jgi:hypothetical protein
MCVQPAVVLHAAAALGCAIWIWASIAVTDRGSRIARRSARSCSRPTMTDSARVDEMGNWQPLESSRR